MDEIHKFDEAIGLIENWPCEALQNSEMDISGLLHWAETYFEAAEILHNEREDRSNFAFYCGPVMQNVGLSAELTFKTLLKGIGKSQKELRSFNHNTYGAYYAARECFDETKFINLHLSNTSQLKTPDEIRARLLKRGEDDVDKRWRVYFDHLRVLDTVYDRPYRNRYVTPGEAILPETEIILVGTKILLSAMRARLNHSM